MKPYFDGGDVVLYLGDSRDVLPALGVTADLVLADPPYGETSLPWDRWPDGWLEVAAAASRSLWCFGSMRMFLLHGMEFATADWKLSQDVIWQKHNGSNRMPDRFRRVHETVTHWYRGKWDEVYHEPPRLVTGVDPRSRVGTSPDSRAEHLGKYGKRTTWTDDGTRLLTSVLPVRSTHHSAIHPTEKPLGILDPLISYACPPSGLVIDPFAGSGSTLDAARQAGRRAIGIEGHEPYAEKAARRLQQLTLEAS